MPDVFLATPATRPFEAEFVNSLWQTKNPCLTIWQTIRNRPSDEARNALGIHFLQHELKPEYILYADSDATWHPEALIRLVERNLPVVTAGIYRRKLPPLPTIGLYVGKNPDGHHMYHFAPVIQRIKEYAKAHGLDEKTDNALCLDKGDEVDDLMEVDGCGAHFLLVRREVLEAIRLPWFRRVGHGAGEDFYFCRKVKEAGYPIYFDLTLHTGHLLGPEADLGIRELLSYFKYVKPEDITAEEGVLDVA